MRISVNYEQLMQQSQCLYVKADEYHQIIESIQQRIHGMASIWQGEDHLMFVSKFDELYPKLNQMTQVHRCISKFNRIALPRLVCWDREDNYVTDFI